MTGHRVWDDAEFPPFALQPDIACADVDAELFFPTPRGNQHTNTTYEAVRICRRCPHTAACLQWALDTSQDYGIWGGTTALQRRQLIERTEMPEPAPATHLVHHDQAITRCCGRSPAELSHAAGHRLTANRSKVTCPALIETAPQKALSATEIDETPVAGGAAGAKGADGAPGASEPDRRWHWKRTNDGGWYSGPGMPDAHCDTCGGLCRQKSDLEDV